MKNSLLRMAGILCLFLFSVYQSFAKPNHSLGKAAFFQVQQQQDTTKKAQTATSTTNPVVAPKPASPATVTVPATPTVSQPATPTQQPQQASTSTTKMEPATPSAPPSQGAPATGATVTNPTPTTQQPPEQASTDTTKMAPATPSAPPALGGGGVEPAGASTDTTGNTVTGVVVDEKSLGMPGVGVKVRGKATAAVTDAEGKFRIRAAAADILEFSFIGYAPQTKPAGNGSSPLAIKLAPAEANKLNEVVVVGVGYGTLKQKEVTSSVAHIDTAQFRQSGARNPLDLIQGKVAGLNLTRTGGSNPNSGVNVQLRGAITVTGSSSPLFVIDGIPGGNPDLLQQDDILSVDVLKDGSGAAIYGTSANAGVILITTKKGKAGPAQFNYNTYFRKEFVQNRLDFLSAGEFREKINQGIINAEDYGGNEDLYGLLLNKDNLSQNHNLSLSGGTDKTNYRASLNYRDLQGIGLENGRNEYTMRLNVNQKGLDDKLTVSMNLATNINKANTLGGGGWEEEMTKNPTRLAYNPDGSFYFNTQSTNQYARLFQERAYRKQQTSSADIKADIDIIEGLRGTVFGSVQRDSYLDGAWASIFSERSVEDADYPNGGFASKGNFLSQAYAFEPTLQYQKVIAEDHNLTALAGYSYRYNIEEGQSAANRGFLNDQFHEDNLTQGLALTDGRAVATSFKNDNTLIGFFGRLNYAFKSKYLLQLSVRREGSSRFGVNNKWGNFPAVSAGWLISEEKFMENAKFVNSLKIRAGYGVTGNSGFVNNASRVLLGGGGRYLYPDGNYRETYGPTTNVNPNLKWESKSELNLGVDFALFENKLTGALDLFDRTTKDLLDSYTTPQPPYVLANIYANVGTISSRGIELALSYQAIKNKDFTFSMDFTGSTLSNKLVSYSDDIFKVEYKTFGGIGGAGDLGDAITTYQGAPLGEFWGKKFAGFDADGKWLFYNRDGQAVRNDQINNSKDRDLTDLQNLGNAIPKYYASYTANLAYRNWDFRMFIRGRFDYKILNTTALTYGNPFVTGRNYLADAFGKYADINDTYMYSDYYLEEGTNVKIDEVTIGYNFKFKNKYVRNLRAYVTGQNLVTLTGYSGNDPDFILDTGLGPGIDNRSAYPSTRSFMFGLSVGF